MNAQLQALHVNLSSEEEWAYSFENFDCLVVTAQLLLDSLVRSFFQRFSGSESEPALTNIPSHRRMVSSTSLRFPCWYLTRRIMPNPISKCFTRLTLSIRLLDVSSTSPFASILRDFYHRTAPEDRPRILGLTASPLDSNEGISDAQRLQKLFNARLITAPEATLPALREMGKICTEARCLSVRLLILSASSVSKPTVLEVKYSPPPSQLFLAALINFTYRGKSSLSDDELVQPGLRKAQCRNGRLVASRNVGRGRAESEANSL